MNRNRHGRDRIGHGYGGGDGLLGEGPNIGGGLFEPMVNSQINQLMIAQQLLQQQASLGAVGNYGGDCGLGNYRGGGPIGGAMHYRQQQGYGGMRNDRKRRGVERDRSRGRDSNRNSEGKDGNRSNQDSDKDHEKKSSGKSKTANDSTDNTEEEDGKEKDKKEDGNLFCHVCNVSVYDEDSFRRHLNGSKHAQRMNSLLTVHQLKSDQLKSRLQAEEHLRKIEGKNGGVDPDYFCKICNNSLTIPWERHRFSNIHKQRQLQVKRGCGWCNVHDFTNFSEVLQHRETDEHKKNAEQFGKKKDGSRSRSRSRERREREEDKEDLTVPEYNPESPVGVSYVIPVTGYFCKLCNKFYNNGKSAKGAHCQSEAHYEKFKQATEAKQEARAKRQAERAEAAAAKKENADRKNEKEDADEIAIKKIINDDDDDDEDYDDDLPVEDEDNDGGLVNDSGLAKDSSSFLNDTNANSSFVFLSGDAAETHLDLQRLQRQLQISGSPLSKSNIDDANVSTSGGEEDRDDDNAVPSDDDNEDTVSGKSSKVQGSNTAKRGRGKGKSKK